MLVEWDRKWEGLRVSPLRNLALHHHSPITTIRRAVILAAGPINLTPLEPLTVSQSLPQQSYGRDKIRMRESTSELVWRAFTTSDRLKWIEAVTAD
jgi:hypothetical protein